MLVRLAASRLDSVADAEDAVQDVFCTLVSKKLVFVDPEYEKAWLIRATINRASDLRRRKSLARLIVARISHAFSYSGSTNTSFLDTSVQNTSCTASSASATESSREAASRTSMRPYSHTSRSMRSSSVTVVPPFFACVLHLQPITRFRRRFYFIPSTLRAIADEIVAEKSLATHQYERQTSQMIMIKVT